MLHGFGDNKEFIVKFLDVNRICGSVVIYNHFQNSLIA